MINQATINLYLRIRTCNGKLFVLVEETGVGTRGARDDVAELGWKRKASQTGHLQSEYSVVHHGTDTDPAGLEWPDYEALHHGGQ